MTRAYLNGEPLQAGTLITDFRGKGWEFVEVSREPEPHFGKSGKVRVRDLETGEETCEFYPSVFGVKLR